MWGMSTATIPRWTIGDRLTKAREHAGLSSQGMAEAMGVHRNTISNWETGKIRASQPVVIAWSSVTGVPTWWILDGDNPIESTVTEGYPTEASVIGLPVAALKIAS
jgi:transcriptional regulator with XRE-family HTH domain